MNLPELAIRRPVLITVVFLIVTLLGAISFMQLPVDLMPDVSFPTLTVQVGYAGVGPEEMEELVSIPLERTLASTPGLEEITSTSSEGSSRIRLSFAWGTDLDAATDEVRARLDRVRGGFPENAGTPTVFRFDVSQFPIMFMGVSGEMDPRQLREFTDRQLQYRFEQIDGVAQADVWGGLSREIHVNLDRSKMHALRISPNQVMVALRRENVNHPVGQVVEGDFEVLMRIQGEYVSLNEIRRTMVTRREGSPVYIEDIAKVEDSLSGNSKSGSNQRQAWTSHGCLEAVGSQYSGCGQGSPEGDQQNQSEFPADSCQLHYRQFDSSLKVQWPM